MLLTQTTGATPNGGASLTDIIAAAQQEQHALAQREQELTQREAAFEAEMAVREAAIDERMQRLTQTNNQLQQQVTLNVGGIFFTTSMTSLDAENDNLLSTGARHGDTMQGGIVDGAIFFDRPSKMFPYILGWLRSLACNTLFMAPESVRECRMLSIEAGYFLLPRLVEYLSKFEHPQMDCALKFSELKAQGLTNFDGYDFSRAELRGVSFAGLSLKHTKFAGSNLSLADFSGAECTGADFSGANMTQTNLSSATLNRINISGANLTQANLQSANCDDANFSGANLAETVFVSTDCLPVPPTFLRANFQNVVNCTAHEMRYPQNVSLYGASYKRLPDCLRGNLVFNSLNDFVENNRAWYAFQYKSGQGRNSTVYANGINNHSSTRT
jgi:hypothetical protein